MANEKKGFIVHFDGCRAVKALKDPEQIGWLFLLLMDYAERCAQDPTLRVEDCLSKFPRLKADAVMAGYFLGDNVQRDTVKWWNKKSSYAQSAREREARKRQNSEGEDKSWMRRCVEQRYREEARNNQEEFRKYVEQMHEQDRREKGNG